MVVPALKLVDQSFHEQGPVDDVPVTEHVSARRPRRTRRANPYVVLPIVGLLLLCAGLLLVNQRVQLMTLTYELETMRQQLSDLQQTNTRLHAAVAGAASLDRMESTARNRLGMVDPGQRTAIVVTPEFKRDVMITEAPSTWAVAGAWLQERLTTTAEAGERTGE